MTLVEPSIHRVNDGWIMMLTLLSGMSLQLLLQIFSAACQLLIVTPIISPLLQVPIL